MRGFFIRRPPFVSTAERSQPQALTCGQQSVVDTPAAPFIAVANLTLRLESYFTHINIHTAELAAIRTTLRNHKQRILALRR